MELEDHSEAEIQVIPKRPSLTALMDQRFPDEEICDHIEKLLTATVGGKEQADGTIKGERPDCRSVESGLRLLLAYKLGLPIQRILRQSQDIPPPPPLDQLASTPAGVEAMIRMVLSVPGGREAFEAATAA